MSKHDSAQTKLTMTEAGSKVIDLGEVAEFLKPKKTMQIAVSGSVLVTEAEREIIDTPDYQRLRRIRQLGLAYLVYPTALHTRFDHSLGTLHMADRMMSAIRENAKVSPEERLISDEQVALTRIYALVHDITHIAFGHTIEDELGLFKRHDENLDRTNHFLGASSDIGQIVQKHFGEEFHKRLLDIYSWDENPDTRSFPADEAFIHDIVSNTVCADLLDYLQRDNYFCNLGVSLAYHFMKYLYLSKDNKDQRRVFVRLWKSDDGGGKPRRDILTEPMSTS